MPSVVAARSRMRLLRAIVDGFLIVFSMYFTGHLAVL